MKAESSDVKLVDPNTGEQVEAKGQQKAQPTKQKAKGKKHTKIVDPNSGKELDTATEQVSQPAATAHKSPPVKYEQTSSPAEKAKPESGSEKEQFVKINRAPVLTLWVAVVAERQGFTWEAGMTFGKAISGMLAQSKGRWAT